MEQIALDIGLAARPTLAGFCVGSNPEALRHLTLQADPSQSGNRSPGPTYLWGESGSGKTHLLMAVHDVLQAQGATFGWLEPAMENIPVFNHHWAAVLMDDVQAFNAEQQHAAFNWFVNAQAQPCWVLAAGTLPPADLQLRDDLRSRLGWGLVFQLHSLSEPERCAVLRQDAGARGLVLSDEAMDFMLTRFSRDLGSLMNLLDRLDHYALQTKRGITIPLIKSMMDNT